MSGSRYSPVILLLTLLAVCLMSMPTAIAENPWDADNIGGKDRNRTTTTTSASEEGQTEIVPPEFDGHAGWYTLFLYTSSSWLAGWLDLDEDASVETATSSYGHVDSQGAVDPR